MASWPDLLDYKQWARVPDSADDDAIADALAAVQDAIMSRCSALALSPDPNNIPAPVREAALLWTNRLMARRNSPEGIVGVEAGAVTVTSFDADVGRLLAPYTTPVLA